MSKKLPFDDDVMTLIMGLGGPEEPGQHGRLTAPAPDGGAVELATKIRDLCEEFLSKCDKSDGSEKPESEDNEKQDSSSEDDSEENQEEK